MHPFGPSSWRWPLVAAVLLAAVSGCSTSSSSATAAADRFEQTLGDEDWAAACAALAPQTRSELEKSAGKACPAALQEEDLPDAGPVDETDTFGTMAQVSFRQDTLFLGEFPSGWKVVAAGCAPVRGAPYDCDLQGG